MLAPVLSGSWWLEFPGFHNPQNPFHDKRVRQAVSLAVDRQAINEAELAGFGKISGNWINNDVQYAMEWPAFERDVERASTALERSGLSERLHGGLAHTCPDILFAWGERRRTTGRLAFAPNSRSWSGGCFCRSYKEG